MGSLPFFVRDLNQISYTPLMFQPREAFIEIAAVSGSDNDRWHRIFLPLSMPGRNGGFKIRIKDWVFDVISAEIKLLS